MPSTTDSEQHEDVHWDGSPLTKQAWYDDLPRQVRRHRTLWERGFVSHRGVIYTSSPPHSYHLSINNIETCTFAKPCPLRAFRLEDPSEATQPLSDAKAKQYVDEPTQLDEGDKNFFEDLIANIDNKQRRKDYRNSTKGSGLALLVQLTGEIDKMNDDLSAWAVEHRAKLVLSGLTAPNVIAFDQFREAYENFTNQMGSRAEPDSVTSKVTSRRHATSVTSRPPNLTSASRSSSRRLSHRPSNSSPTLSPRSRRPVHAQARDTHAPRQARRVANPPATRSVTGSTTLTGNVSTYVAPTTSAPFAPPKAKLATT